MTLNIQLPEVKIMKPRITVFGVGGAGGNATNNMITRKLEGANFIIANTDAQALELAVAEKRIQLGQHTTQGLGAGADPEVGRMAAEEAREEIEKYLQGSNMVFVTAGMGGGTGTGASAVIAKIARDLGILTVGVVTKPFHFEGPRRMRVAEQGIIELQKNVDTLIVIPNQNLFRVANEKTTFAEAFAMADEVLRAGVRGVTDLMVMPGLINLDFADIRTVMSEMGKAMMGTGEASGEKRAQEAADAAISNPLLDNVSMKGAKGVLINITGGPDMTLFEVDEAANRVREEVDPAANVIFGSTFDDAMEGKIRVSVVATGIDSENIPKDEFDKLAKEPEKKIPSSVGAYRPGVRESVSPIGHKPNQAGMVAAVAKSPITSSAEAQKPEAQPVTQSINVGQTQQSPLQNQLSHSLPNSSQLTPKAQSENPAVKVEQRYEQTVKRMNWEFDDARNKSSGQAESSSLTSEKPTQKLEIEGDAVSPMQTTSQTETKLYRPATPVQPESYHVDPPLTSQQWKNFQANDQKDRAVQKTDGGLLSRMARSMTKPFQSSEEGSNNSEWGNNNEWDDKLASKAVEGIVESVITKKETVSADDELLDIPAFLRRNQ